MASVAEAVGKIHRLGDGVPADVAEHLWHETGGVPFHLEQLARVQRDGPQPASTGSWYRNPGSPANATDAFWTASLISATVAVGPLAA